MQTVIHYYRFNTVNASEYDEYVRLTSALQISGLVCLLIGSSDSTRPYFHTVQQLNGQKVTLETEHLFNNQWNIQESSLRVFDWGEFRFPNAGIKEGHWLEQTKEMSDIRANTYQCGYCRKVSPKEDVFCRKCLGSEYLERKELVMLRLLAVADRDEKRKLLSNEELEWLLPLYKEAQGLGKQDREAAKLSKARQSVAGLISIAEKEAKYLVDAAKIKTEAYTWLLDNELPMIDNCIYYQHNGKFAFGWRTPIRDKTALAGKLVDFPFDYEIK